MDIKKYVKAFKISSVEFFEIAEDLHDGVDPKEKRQDVLQTTPIIKIGKIVNGATGTAIEENSLFENFIGDYQNEDYFCLDVESDELKNDNILKKDIVLIKKSESLEYNGQICIVQMEDSTLLTHVYKHNSDIILQSSDLSISPIVFKENETKKFKILGTLKGIQRNY